MTSSELTTVEIEAPGETRAAVIWMHGLGADGHDFEPIVPQLRLPADAGIRFIFPNAPLRPVTINGGMVMRAWYDILSPDLPRREDPTGVLDSERALRALIERERARGIAAGRILLAGFSQGGAMALHTGLRYPQPLAGIAALSCYVPLADSLEQERAPVNQSIPIFMAHGDHDGVIPLRYGQAALQQIRALGYRPDWHPYNMGHEVCWEEIRDLGAWLTRLFGSD